MEVFGLNFGHDGAFFVTTTFDFWRGLTDNSGGLSMTCGLPLFSSFLISQLHKIKMTQTKERLKQFSMVNRHTLPQLCDKDK